MSRIEWGQTAMSHEEFEALKVATGEESKMQALQVAARFYIRHLAGLPTKTLVEELRKREGVVASIIEPHEVLRMEDGHGNITGPAILLKITD